MFFHHRLKLNESAHNKQLMNLIFRCKEGGDQFDSAYIFYLGMTLVTGSKCLRFFQNFQFQFEKKK